MLSNRRESCSTMWLNMDMSKLIVNLSVEQFASSQAWLARHRYGLTSRPDRRHSPDDIRQVVGDQQRAARIDRDPDRTPAGLSVLAHEAGDEVDRLPGRPAAAERDEDDLVAGRLVAIPAAVHSDEDPV